MTLERQALLDDTSLVGRAWCSAYTQLVDDWLAQLRAGRRQPRGPGVALVAVGGYGRAELAPSSDIDVVLLHGGRPDVAEVAERIWYPVWDDGVKLGHAVRTIGEALRSPRTTSTPRRRCSRSGTSPATKD